MPIPIDRDAVQSLIADGAQLADVLPRPEYDWAHLAGAVHLPLKSLDAERAGHVLERGRPVIVYCNDFQCDMSPRAAWQLEQLG